VKNAAVALADLHLDPMTYLRANRFEQMVLHQVIEQAHKRMREQRKNEAISIGAAVGHAIGKLFRRK
jgi:hypothetical protein